MELIRTGCPSTRAWLAKTKKSRTARAFYLDAMSRSRTTWHVDRCRPFRAFAFACLLAFALASAIRYPQSETIENSTETKDEFVLFWREQRGTASGVRDDDGRRSRPARNIIIYMPKKKKADSGPPKPKVPPETLAAVAILSDANATADEKAMAAHRLGAFASAADVQRNDLGSVGAVEALTQALMLLAEPLPRNLAAGGTPSGSCSAGGSCSSAGGSAAESLLAARLNFAEQAAYALRQLSANNPLSVAYDNVGKIVAAGGAAIFVEWLRPPSKHRMPASDTLKEHVVACLCNMAKKNAYREAIAACQGGIEALVTLVGNRDGRSTVSMRRDAAFCLGGLSFCHEPIKALIVEAGAVPVLNAIIAPPVSSGPPGHEGLSDQHQAAQLQQVAGFPRVRSEEYPRATAPSTRPISSSGGGRRAEDEVMFVGHCSLHLGPRNGRYFTVNVNVTA